MRDEPEHLASPPFISCFMALAKTCVASCKCTVYPKFLANDVEQCCQAQYPEFVHYKQGRIIEC